MTAKTDYWKARRQAALKAFAKFFDECAQGLWDRDHFVESWQRKYSKHVEFCFDSFNSPMPPDAYEDVMGDFDELQKSKIDALVNLRHMNREKSAFDRKGEPIENAIPKEAMIPLYAAQLRALPDDKLVALVAQMAAMVSDFQDLSESLNEVDEPTEFLSSYYKHRIIKEPVE